ncbi:hypothetical protein Plec18167_002686 [Paecilomyces lecythidis]|uniref:Immediate-early protein n=1 Tax=Paecilomyces lecythidis TaxID=3004212 RepID=A0ABR3Y6L2_9EURO
MFSQFVTAAKGLFAKKDSEEEIPGNADYSSDPAAIQEHSDCAPSKTATMVMTTRSGRTAPVEEETLVEVNGSRVGNAKRKAESASSAKTNGESTKRRKRVSVDKQVNGDEESSSTHEEKVAAVEKPKHFRFGSEEPAPADELVEEVPETQQNGAQSAEDSDDDEAPEAFDNSAQLLRMKEQAQKQERARQKAELLKKEKRRQLDELHKTQAKSASKKKDIVNGARKADYQDDISESTATLQGSVIQDSRRPALPALLPDEILNAAPDVRPPTPPPEDVAPEQKKPNKLRFLDKVEKAPKDIRRGGTAVRVLDGKKSTAVLPPKISKAGRNVREGWLTGKRASVAQVNGLRRTTGGSSGFVRSR